MANPGISVSTKDAYTAIDSLKAYSGKASKQLFINDLESYTLAGYPEAAELKRIMNEELEADMVLMSGSGPTMIAYYSEKDKAGSDFSKLEKISKSHSGWRLWFTQTGSTL
jgi:4-diphosphocytidyl-2-C-methyl-D-erythritol kinase